MKKKYAVAAMISIILIVFDQLTKWLAVAYLKGQQPISIIKDVFELQYLENKGAAFGMMQGKQLFFVIITCVMLVVLAFYYGKIPSTKRFMPIRIIAICIFSGAIGNLIDRISYNYVIDFFYFKLIDFPIFNVADIYVSCATVALIVLIIFFYKEEEFEAIFPSKKKREDS